MSAIERNFRAPASHFSEKCLQAALAKEWTSFYDITPDADRPFLHSCDGRKPLTFKMLKDTIRKPT
eukprot:1438476-Amphidinium_carterae.1